MAQRRMFSPEIVCSDEFLEMSASARELYFQLGMRADDDGFIQPRSVMKLLGSPPDDLKVLLQKRFLLPFETGVVVIKHWLIHNMIRADRYKETRFIEEKNRLYIKPNKAYTENPDNGTSAMATKWQPNGNHLAPQVRLGKVSKTTEIRISAPPYKEERGPSDSERVQGPQTRAKDKEAVYHRFSSKNEPWMIFTHEKKAALALFDRGLDKLDRGLQIMREHEDDRFCPQAGTPSEYVKKMPSLNRYIKRHEL